MELFVVKPETYYDGENDFNWMRLIDIAKICNERPAEIWKNWCFTLVGNIDGGDIDDLFVAPAPRVLILSAKTEEKFYMDPDGNVVDENCQRTGLRVNGLEGQSVGGWEDIYVPEEWAEITLKKRWGGGYCTNITR